MATYDSLFPNLRELPDKPPRRELLPGLKRPPFTWQVMWVIPFVLLFGGILMAMILAAQTQNSVYRSKATAQVLDREPLDTQSTSKGMPSVFLKYRFRVQGHDVISRILVDSSDATLQLAPGQWLAVAYNPANPKENMAVSALKQQQAAASPWIFVIFIPFVALIWFVMLFGPMLFPRLKAWLQARRVYQQGFLAQGSIVFVHENGNRQLHMSSSQVIYSFRDHLGTQHESHQDIPNVWLVNQWHVNSPVVVAYDVKNPRHSVLLEPFCAARH